MTVNIESTGDDTNRRVGENIATLMFRMGFRQRGLALAAGITPNTLGRKLKGVGDWSVREVQAIAAVTWVTVPELLGDLPDFETWRARRDSNSQPSDP